MENLTIPLISPLSRKYYAYACEESGHKHHRGEDIRICLEYVCDQIIFNFVSVESQNHWSDYDLHDKLKASKSFLDKRIVNRLIEAKIIGNKAVHNGEEGDYSEEDINKAIKAIQSFSLEVFYSYFKRNGFDYQQQSWVPTVFSTLPPAYRVTILEKYYKNCNKSPFVIDKLSKAYLKSGSEKKAHEFLSKCCNNKEISIDIYEILDNDISILKANLSRLPIASDLETAKENFNKLLPAIEDNKRDSFVCLVSMILNGVRVGRN